MPNKRQHNEKDDTIIDDEWHSLLEKYTSHFIWKSCVWEGVWDRTELQHIDPHSYGHQRWVFLVLQGGSTGCCFLYSSISPPLLIPKHNRRSRGPLLLGAGFLYHILSLTSLVFKLTYFLSPPSYIIVHANSTVFGMACLIVIERL